MATCMLWVNGWYLVVMNSLFNNTVHGSMAGSQRRWLFDLCAPALDCEIGGQPTNILAPKNRTVQRGALQPPVSTLLSYLSGGGAGGISLWSVPTAAPWPCAPDSADWNSISVQLAAHTQDPGRGSLLPSPCTLLQSLLLGDILTDRSSISYWLSPAGTS